MIDAKRNWAMGQAYFARAYAYFWAARLWGDVPLNLRPIESVDQPETYPVRAPKADVYARIGSDIESALALSDALGSDKYLATKTAVLMLKAEYCLWMYSAQKGGDAYLDGAEDALEAAAHIVFHALRLDLIHVDDAAVLHDNDSALC